MFDSAPRTLAAWLLAALLGLTLAWHVPMMLWDQLDLVPLYQAWHDHALTPSDLFRPRAGHVHGIAYLVLLPSAFLSRGDPWLDCLISWCLLTAFALLVLQLVRSTLLADSSRQRVCVLFLVLFALTPGHLANLQWGWQVAVFISLLCTAVVIASLTQPRLGLTHVCQSLVAALIAFGSFATALALVPAALAMLAYRHDVPRRLRLGAATAWCLLGGSAIVLTAWSDRADVPAGAPAPGVVLHYALNFLGAAVCRFATSLAPAIAAVGVALAALAWRRTQDQRAALPWLGFAVFGLASALLIAVARAGQYGADQAFVTRYVSFSSMFWVGLMGLVARMQPLRALRRPAVAGPAIALLAVLIAVNSAQMTRKAAHVHAEAALAARQIERTFPNVPESVLASAYFDAPDEAWSLLLHLRSLGLAPFSRVDATPRPDAVHRDG